MEGTGKYGITQGLDVWVQGHTAFFCLKKWAKHHWHKQYGWLNIIHMLTLWTGFFCYWIFSYQLIHYKCSNWHIVKILCLWQRNPSWMYQFNPRCLRVGLLSPHQEKAMLPQRIVTALLILQIQNMSCQVTAWLNVQVNGEHQETSPP